MTLQAALKEKGITVKFGILPNDEHTISVKQAGYYIYDAFHDSDEWKRVLSYCQTQGYHMMVLQH